MQGDTTYLTVKEIAAELRVTKQVVWRWIREGKLPALRIGKEYRVSRADYLAFLAKHRKRPPPSG
jgi:excisionase family DNA binding protein